MPYISRALEPIVLRAAREFPVVMLTGPRQSRKTSLLSHLLGKSHRWVSLELPDYQAAARSAALLLFLPLSILDFSLALSFEQSAGHS